MIGKTISHYKILEKLGEGGMGVVYKAQDLKLDRFVALKFLPPHIGADEEEKKRFIHEAKAASALQHNNVSTIHEIDEMDDSQMFICMDYYEGETLKNKIERGPLKLEDVFDFAIQAAQGLARAHEEDIIHRDIKPANVIVTKHDVVKIVDFGLAKLAGRTKLTKTGTTLGTAAYMSPEQTRGEEVNHRTDIWSLGVILYEMITGQLPFKGDYEQAVSYSIVNEEPEPMTGLRTGLPMELERIVNKALGKSPDERYQTIGDMLVDLRSSQKQLTSKEKEPTYIEEKSRKRKRTPLYAVSGLLLILLMLIVGRRIFFPAGSVEKAIAVLPLENLSGDPEQEYFADGMTDALIADLGKIGALSVISRQSVIRYKGSDKSLPEIARELNVDFVVEGTVFHSGEKVRITAQLIEGATDRHLWAESYERDLRDILTLQSQVALAIAKEIRVKLTPEQEELLTKTRPVNPELQELYLKGWYYLNKRTKEGIDRASEYFQQAIEIDPNDARAYVGLSDCYGFYGFYGYIPPKEGYSKAIELAKKALEIDESLAEAHRALASLKFYYDWDWAGAEKEFKRAHALNPNMGGVNQYAWLLLAVGRFDEAIAEAERTLRLDPFTYAINAELMNFYTHTRKYDQALAQCQHFLELGLGDVTAYRHFAKIYELMGNFEDCVRYKQKEMTLSGYSPEDIEALGLAYSQLGPRGYWMYWLDRTKGRYDRDPTITAQLYAQLGDKDQAFAWLEEAYEKHDMNLFRLKYHPRYDPLRDDPRFQDLLRRMNFPE